MTILRIDFLSPVGTVLLEDAESMKDLPANSTLKILVIDAQGEEYEGICFYMLETTTWAPRWLVMLCPWIASPKSTKMVVVDATSAENALYIKFPVTTEYDSLLSAATAAISHTGMGASAVYAIQPD